MPLTNSSLVKRLLDNEMDHYTRLTRQVRGPHYTDQNGTYLSPEELAHPDCKPWIYFAGDGKEYLYDPYQEVFYLEIVTVNKDFGSEKDYWPYCRSDIPGTSCNFHTGFLVVLAPLLIPYLAF